MKAREFENKKEKRSTRITLVNINLIATQVIKNDEVITM